MANEPSVGAHWPVRRVIEQAVTDWLAKRSTTLSHPVDDETLGQLSAFISRRLIEAGLIDEEPPATARDDWA